jgi:hypothetical protein
LRKEPIADAHDADENVRPDEARKDQKPGNAVPEAAAGKVETDAEIEDRFEATDN